MSQMQQMCASLSFNDGSRQNRTCTEEAPPSPVCQEHHRANQLHYTEISSASTGNSVKFLASLIPTFGGTEDVDVEIWINKIESVEKIHNK